MAEGAEGRPGAGTKPSEPDDSVVALQVDKEKFTRGEIKNYIRTVLKESKIDPQVFGEKIHTMVLDILGYEEARKEYPGIEEDYTVRADIGKFRSEQLAPLYFNEMVYKKVNPTVKEIADALPLPKRRYEVSIIVSQSRENLDEAIALLEKGKDFHETAAAHSEGWTREKGGRLGTIEEGNEDLLTKEEFEHVSALKPGRFTQAIRIRIGWAVVSLDRVWEPGEIRMEQAKVSYDSKKMEMERKLFQELYAGLRDKASVAVHDNTIDRIYDALSSGKPLSDETKRALLAEVNGVPVYTAELRNIMGAHGKNDIYTYLEKRVRDEIVAQEAQRLGFRDAGVSALLELHKKRVITRRYLEKKVVAASEVDEKQLRGFYEENKARFASKEYRKILAIELDSKEKTREAQALLKRGTDFRKVASEYNRNEDARKLSGELGYVKRSDLSPQVAEKVFSLKEGERTDPMQFTSGDGTTLQVIVKVEAIRPSRTIPFEELDRQVLRDKFVAGKMDDFYKNYMERIFKEHDVKVLNALETNNRTRG